MHYATRVEQFGEESFARLERFLLLDTVDRQWKDHLLALDHLREGIGLRAYGQRNPLVEYKRECYALFEDMWEHIEDHVVKFLYHAEPVERMEHRRQGVTTTMSHPEAQALKASHEQQEQRGQHAGGPAARRRPRCGGNNPRWVETIRAHAVRARSTRSATVRLRRQRGSEWMSQFRSV